VAAIIEQGDQILMARKKGWPHNKWVLIAGFPEAGETMEEAILREVDEESGLKGEAISLIGVYSLPWANQVFIVYRVKVPLGKVTVCSELENIQPFHPNQIPQVISELYPQDGAARALRDYLLSQAVDDYASSPKRNC
jgi:NADH pyrophosphatase NudC (nudix superfamily)